MPVLENEEQLRIHAFLSVSAVQSIFPGLTDKEYEELAFVFLELEAEDLEPMTLPGYALSCTIPIPSLKTAWDYLEEDL